MDFGGGLRAEGGVGSVLQENRQLKAEIERLRAKNKADEDMQERLHQRCDEIEVLKETIASLIHSGGEGAE